MFQNLRPLILTKLLGVSALVTALDYHSEDTTGYPYATFEPSNLQNNYFTTSDNLREYAFDIIIFQEMKTAGRDAAIENLCKAVDAVVTAFDTDSTLTQSGYCQYVRALPAEWGEYVNKAGPIKYAKLTLVCGIEVAV